MERGYRSAAGILMVLLLLLSQPAAAQTGFNCSSGAELLAFLKTEHQPSAPLLPPSANIADGFKPGPGKPSGTVQLAQGLVAVLHQGDSTFYRLHQGLPVFNGDTLITGKGSRVTLLMADQSVLTLTALSKLVIDRSLASPHVRDTWLQLLFGRVRAIVSKVKGEGGFTVKTPTVIAGVRGTDFALAVGPSLDNPSVLTTAALTGAGNSTVELAGEAGAPARLGPLSVTEAVSDCPVCPPFQIGDEAVRALRAIAPETEQAAAAGASSAAAKWTEDFFQNENLFGLERAVENALEHQISPADILRFIVSNQDRFGIHRCLKALYCAGVDRDIVQVAAARLGIAEQDQSIAFGESVQECGSKLSLSDRDILDLPETGDFASPSRP